jgi:iron complex outermembrane receptor protein
VTAEASAVAAIEIPEIVVTAQRRSEPLSRIPMSVSVLDQDALAASGIRAPADIATALANVDVTEPFGNAFSMFAIRGLGLNDYNVNNNPTVAVYRDGAFLSSNAMIPKVLFDLARIEVLKGPQGTLYGRNATGGAINLMSALPGDLPEGYAVFGYGNFKTVDVEGAVGGPIAENAGVRLSGFAKRRFSGHQLNRTTGQRHGEIETWALRGIAAYRATDTLAFTLILNGGRDASDMTYFQHRGTLGPMCRVASEGVHDPASCTDLFGYSDTDGQPHAGDYSRTPRIDDSTYGATLKTAWEGEGVALDLTTNAERYRFRNTKEEDSSPQTALEIDYDSDIHQISQDIQLSSNTDSSLAWMVGAMLGYYRHDEQRSANITAFERAFGPLFGSPIVTLPYRQTTRTAAVFADGSWMLTPRLTLTGGLRASSERISYRGGTFIPAFSAPIVQIDNRIATDKLSWRTALTYEHRPGLTYYASASSGFKSGGFFGGFAFSPNDLAPYRPETVTGYEIGVRAAPTGTLALNVAGFFYDYDDLQAVAIDSVGAGNAITISRLRNLPGAVHYGLDLEAEWRPDSAFSLRAAFGLLDTRVRGPASAYGSAGAGGPVFNVAGNEVPRAPHVSASLTGTYTADIGPEMRLRVASTVRFRSKTYFDLINSPMATQPAYLILDTRLALSRNAGWEIAAWGKNLTNRVPYTGDGAAGFGERDLVSYGMPRIYGVEARLNF